MGNRAIFKDFIMPKIFRKEYSGFEEFSCGIVGSFGIGQKETQDILRNKWGKKTGNGDWNKSNSEQRYNFCQAQ